MLILIHKNGTLFLLYVKESIFRLISWSNVIYIVLILIFILVEVGVLVLDPFYISYIECGNMHATITFLHLFLTLPLNGEMNSL
jgi:NADH:ubiquinone oxidoreductase subunit 3 (subunit A)